MKRVSMDKGGAIKGKRGVTRIGKGSLEVGATRQETRQMKPSGTIPPMSPLLRTTLAMIAVLAALLVADLVLGFYGLAYLNKNVGLLMFAALLILISFWLIARARPPMSMLVILIVTLAIAFAASTVTDVMLGFFGVWGIGKHVGGLTAAAVLFFLLHLTGRL